MSDRSRPKEAGRRAEAVAAYKQILRDVLDRRPSGTRQRLAQALGKARSFVSQITSPAYSIAIPVQHLAPIFEICHFSAAEREGFLDAYRVAHPRSTVTLEPRSRLRPLHLLVPDLGSDAANQDLDRLIHDYVAGLAKVWAAARPVPEKGAALFRKETATRQESEQTKRERRSASLLGRRNPSQRSTP